MAKSTVREAEQSPGQGLTGSLRRPQPRHAGWVPYRMASFCRTAVAWFG